MWNYSPLSKPGFFFCFFFKSEHPSFNSTFSAKFVLLIPVLPGFLWTLWLNFLGRSKSVFLKWFASPEFSSLKSPTKKTKKPLSFPFDGRGQSLCSESNWKAFAIRSPLNSGTLTAQWERQANLHIFERWMDGLESGEGAGKVICKLWFCMGATSSGNTLNKWGYPGDSRPLRLWWHANNNTCVYLSFCVPISVPHGSTRERN